MIATCSYDFVQGIDDPFVCRKNGGNCISWSSASDENDSPDDRPKLEPTRVGNTDLQLVLANIVERKYITFIFY